jgi:hypothetical protein
VARNRHVSRIKGKIPLDVIGLVRSDDLADRLAHVLLALS